MKSLGMFLVFSACVSLGVFYCRERKKRLCGLQQLLSALELMCAELGSRSLPMPELCKQLARRSGDLLSPFFARLAEGMQTLGERSFSALWADCAEEKLSYLGRQTLEELSTLGENLGRYELSYQLSALSSVTVSLRAALEQARSAYPGERRLGMGLGLTAGLLVLIMGF